METLIGEIGDFEAFRAYWEILSQRTNPEFTIYVNALLDDYPRASHEGTAS